MEISKTDELRRTLDVLFQPGDVVELRVPINKNKTCAGFYDKFDMLVQDALAFDGKANVYITINQVRSELLARCSNAYMNWAKDLTTDAHIMCRRWFYIDGDSTRATGISATNEERAASLQRAQDISDFLRSQGWGDPVWGDSGNGDHLLYPINLPNDYDTLVLMKALMSGLSRRFDDDQVKIDQTVTNAARIMKFWGTKAVKGDDFKGRPAIPARPHRYSHRISAPEKRKEVPMKVLQATLAVLPPPPEGAPPPSVPCRQPTQFSVNGHRPAPADGPKPDFDLEDWLARHCVGHRPPVTTTDRRCMYILDACPFDPSHVGKDAAVFLASDGSLGFRCFHASCSGRGWREFRLQFEPDAYDHPSAQAQAAPMVTARPMLQSSPLPAPRLDEQGTVAPWSPDQCTPNSDSAWTLASDGVYYTRKTKSGPITERVLGQQIQVVQRAADLDAAIEYVTIRWGSHMTGWSETTVERRLISDVRSIIALANGGLSVNSNNAKDVVGYLAHVLDYHQLAIPVTSVVSKCGWKRINGEDVFMLGQQSLSISRQQVSLSPSADPDGFLDAMGPITTEPSWSKLKKQWVDLARRLGGMPVAAFGVGAAFLPPLLADLKLAQNPILDFGGLSSCGKTSLITMAASVWGLPPEILGGLIRPWASTPVFIERTAALCNDLPIFLDESHLGKAEVVAGITYQYGNGTGKGRGNRDGGVQKTAKYRGVLFSAGEARLTDASNFDGVQGRVCGFWGNPFGVEDTDMITDINKTSTTCYGIVGPLVLRHYMGDRPGNSKRVQNWFTKALARLRPKTQDGIGARLAAICAAVEAAMHLANDVLKLEWNVSTIVDKAFAKVLGGRRVDSATAAMEYILSWTAGHRANFCGGDEAFPTNTWDAPTVRDVFGRMHEGHFAILPDCLQRTLEAAKIPFRSTIAHWHDRGWLTHDKGHLTFQLRNGAGRQRYYLTNDLGKKAAGLMAADADPAPETPVEDTEPEPVPEPPVEDTLDGMDKMFSALIDPAEASGPFA